MTLHDNPAPDLAPDPAPEILAGLRPSGPRRVFAVAVLGGFGFVLVTLALRNPGGAFALTLALLAVGLGAMWMAWRLWGATAQGLILTGTALLSTDGQVLALIDDIASLDRGLLAIRPAGGFSIVLRHPGSRVWQPGLWWRAGRRVGVGGVTNRHQARHLAERIAALLAARRG